MLRSKNPQRLYNKILKNHARIVAIVDRANKVYSGIEETVGIIDEGVKHVTGQIKEADKLLTSTTKDMNRLEKLIK